MYVTQNAKLFIKKKKKRLRTIPFLLKPKVSKSNKLNYIVSKITN